METKETYINRLKHKLRDLKISYQFLHTQLGGYGEILDYYKQEIKAAQEEIDLALSSSN